MILQHVRPSAEWRMRGCSLFHALSDSPDYAVPTASPASFCHPFSGLGWLYDGRHTTVWRPPHTFYGDRHTRVRRPS